MSHDNNLGSLRFVGAYLVVVGHSWGLSSGDNKTLDPVSIAIREHSPFNEPLHGIGVMLFFVISGFLVTASFERCESLFQYVVARVMRIYPALLVVVVACALLLGPAMTSLPLSSYFGNPRIFEYMARNGSLLVDLQMPLPGVFRGNPVASVNGSLWTLPIELWMYGLVMLFGVLRAFRHRHVFNGIAVLLVLAFAASPGSFTFLVEERHQHLGLCFLLGALAHVNREAIVYRGWGLMALWLLALLASASPIHDLVATIAFAYSILWIGFHPRIRLPKLDRFGDFSYGIYLYAFPVQQVSIAWLGGGHPALVMGITLPVATLLGACSWYAVEKPALAWKRRYLDRPPEKR